MSHPLRLVVGLGNPGDQYRDTRHNAGAWFVSRYAGICGASFKDERKFFGRSAIVTAEGRELRLLVPTTYMNESGRCVGAVARFYRIAPQEILIAHDELDLPTGVARFKAGGGLAGHNGLRDITAALGGDQSFNRLRIGVGHPGHQAGVIGHVLSKASREDKALIDACIDEAIRFMPLAIEGEWEKAMNGLNGFDARVEP